MPNGHVSKLSNFEAYLIGSGLSELDTCFIIPIEKNKSLNGEINYKNSLFVGTKESCLTHLKEYPGCKMI